MCIQIFKIKSFKKITGMELDSIQQCLQINTVGTAHTWERETERAKIVSWVLFLKQYRLSHFGLKKVATSR